MYSELFEKINYTFKDIKLLKKSFTHSSYASEKGDKFNSNERLEFLGDAVLDLIIGKEIFLRYDDMPEGDLTKFRASLVCEESLADYTKKLGLNKYLLLGNGEINSKGYNKDSILADLFEAFIGALYLEDSQFCEKFIVVQFDAELACRKNTKQVNDYKSFLQEHIQKSNKNGVKFVIVGDEGPDHNKTFFANVVCNGKIIGEASGRNKKEAEQNAASDAIKKMGIRMI